jgi:hypothetical protein
MFWYLFLELPLVVRDTAMLPLPPFNKNLDETVL